MAPPRAGPREKDRKVERAVLDFILNEHPAQLTTSELEKELTDGVPDFSKTDSIQRAVRDLGGAGLIHRHGDTVRPTRSALYFHRLEAS